MNARSHRERVDRYAALLPEVREREAARRLFSLLADFEEIAVLAAERGDGVAGQLEDELVHRDAFSRAAARLGGKEPRPSEVGALVGYLTGLRGPASLAALNVVAEGWLAELFRHVSTWGVADELFELVGRDEERHATEALAAARPPRDEAQRCVLALEQSLGRVVASPRFLLPLERLGGRVRVARLGLATYGLHRRLCRALGVLPGRDSRYMRAAALVALLAGEPEPVPVGAARRARLAAYGVHNTMLGEVWCRFRSRRSPLVEAHAVRAVARAVARTPGANLVRRGRRGVWEPRNVVVAVRRDHSPGEPLPIYVTNPHRLEPMVVARRIRHRLSLARSEPYPEYQELAGLEELLPPAGCSWVVSYTGAAVRQGQDAVWGWGAPGLNELEGMAGSVVIGPVDGEGWARVGFEADHGAIDGPAFTQVMESVARDFGGESRGVRFRR